MKKIFATFMILATAIIVLPLAADAQTYTTRRVTRNGRIITTRVYTSQQNRRYNGYNNRYSRNGITARERARLARERNRYYRTANRATRDGVITRKEARKLNRQANKYSRRVNRARNN
jgi:hypothetical protein